MEIQRRRDGDEFYLSPSYPYDDREPILLRNSGVAFPQELYEKLPNGFIVSTQMNAQDLLRVKASYFLSIIKGSETVSERIYEGRVFPTLVPGRMTSIQNGPHVMLDSYVSERFSDQNPEAYFVHFSKELIRDQKKLEALLLEASLFQTNS